MTDACNLCLQFEVDSCFWRVQLFLKSSSDILTQMTRLWEELRLTHSSDQLLQKSSVEFSKSTKKHCVRFEICLVLKPFKKWWKVERSKMIGEIGRMSTFLLSSNCCCPFATKTTWSVVMVFRMYRLLNVLSSSFTKILIICFDDAHAPFSSYTYSAVFFVCLLLQTSTMILLPLWRERSNITKSLGYGGELKALPERLLTTSIRGSRS